jgi:hypothetical protein
LMTREEHILGEHLQKKDLKPIGINSMLVIQLKTLAYGQILSHSIFDRTNDFVHNH